MEAKVTFASDGLKLAGIVRTPENLSSGERRPAFVILHGFGGNKDGHGQKVMTQQLTEWGYVTMRIDFRGCGESEGEHGRILCLDQVADTSSAISYMASRPDVDPERVALVGSSFGAAVAIYSGGADSRVAAVISSGGWGDGGRKFRRQHPTPDAWERFTNMLEEGRRYRQRTGRSLMVPRFDIVPIPERLRGNMSAGSIMEFPAETAQSMYDFRADEMVDKISPRPLLLLHSANDSVTPTYESIELFRRAQQPAELYLLSDVDHFMFNQENPRVTRLVFDWLERFFPMRK
jgi:dipeptidyl aminopeptidase/acylaminoacyl peptidase